MDNQSRAIIFVSVICALALAFAVYRNHERRAAILAMAVNQSTESPAAPPAVDDQPVPLRHAPAGPSKNIPSPGAAPSAIAPTPRSAPPVRQQRNNNPPAPQPLAPDPGLAAPEARVALSYVGADPDAEQVWLNAINDPSIPADERQNLIEDLNEDGFDDPHHLTPDDLSLILSRIRLIESIGPDAMDNTNAAAFQEAYKDLTNMLSDPNPL